MGLLMETGVQDVAFSGKLSRDRAGCVGTWGTKTSKDSIFLLIQIEMFFKLTAQASPALSLVVSCNCSFFGNDPFSVTRG